MGDRPLLLDLFCGAGGAAMGYHRAGFDVVGVDIVPQPHYPFEFHQGDAMTWPLDGYDAIHASPPCQDHSVLNMAKHGTGWMLAETIERLRVNGAPWIVENVQGAKREMGGAWTMLCGSTFGLSVDSPFGTAHLRRHRLFASSILLMTSPCQCAGKLTLGVYGHGDSPSQRHRLYAHGYKGDAEQRRTVMGIDWMNRDELSQAIPPAYTEFIGAQLLQHVKAAA